MTTMTQNQFYSQLFANSNRSLHNNDENIPTTTLKRSTSTEVKIEPECTRQEECKKETPVLSNMGNIMAPPTNYKRANNQQTPQIQIAGIPKDLYMALYQNIKKKVIQDLFIQMATQPHLTNNSYLVKRKLDEMTENKKAHICEPVELKKKIQLTQEKAVSPVHHQQTPINTPSTQTSETTTPTKKSRKRISMSQNYKGVLTRGFARTVVQSRETSNSEIHKKLQTVLSIHQQLGNETLKDYSITDLENIVFKYIKDNIQGKVSYQTKNNKEAESSKINSNTQIKKVFFTEAGDDTLTSFSKKVSYEMMIYFLTSNHFDDWVKVDCQSTEENKEFLVLNKEEFKKVFESPITYKPKFRTPVSADE